MVNERDIIVNVTYRIIEKEASRKRSLKRDGVFIVTLHLLTLTTLLTTTTTMTTALLTATTLVPVPVPVLDSFVRNTDLDRK